ncbi:MAG: Lin1244/Lin1753 domain-containing protein [Cyanobacteria bacterium P01_H01_bin.121]
MKWYKHALSAREDERVDDLIAIHSICGYGLWIAIQEELFKAEDEGFKIEATDRWLRRMARQLNMADSLALARIIDTLAEVDLINVQHWAERVLYSPEVESLGKQYTARKEGDRRRKQAATATKSQDFRAESTQFRTESTQLQAESCGVCAESVQSRAEHPPDLDLEERRGDEIREKTGRRDAISAVTPPTSARPLSSQGATHPTPPCQNSATQTLDPESDSGISARIVSGLLPGEADMAASLCDPSQLTPVDPPTLVTPPIENDLQQAVFPEPAKALRFQWTAHRRQKLAEVFNESKPQNWCGVREIGGATPTGSLYLDHARLGLADCEGCFDTLLRRVREALFVATHNRFYSAPDRNFNFPYLFERGRLIELSEKYRAQMLTKAAPGASGSQVQPDFLRVAGEWLQEAEEVV